MIRVTRTTLYRYVGPNGELREFGEKVLNWTRILNIVYITNVVE